MKYIICFVIFFYSKGFADTLSTAIKNIGDYKTKITFNPENAYGQITILKGSKIVYQEGEIGHHFFFGLDFDKKDDLSGRNITGNNIPNLIVTRWTGGASCCYHVSVFELGTSFRKIIEIDAFTTQYNFIDLDKDNTLEIEVMDGAIRGVFASTADSPNGKIIFKFTGSNYVVATDLMRKKITSLQTNIFKKKMMDSFKHSDGPDLPRDFLETMMDLSYSGNLSLALQIAAQIWPLGKKSFNKFKADFQTSLNESQYWKEFSDSLKK